MQTKKTSSKKARIGLIGCGTFALNTHIPVFLYYPEIEIVNVCTTNPESAQKCQRLIGADQWTTNPAEIWEDSTINAVFIYTRHDTHAHYAKNALQAGKNVFCEKPMSLTVQDAHEIVNIVNSNSVKYVVGYNRRFSPLITRIKTILTEKTPPSPNKTTSPIQINYRIASGFIPGDHWIYDPKVGGGKIIGEGCHFLDTICYLMDDTPVKMMATGTAALHTKKDMKDSFGLHLDFGKKGTALIHYNEAAGGDIGKERLVISGADLQLIMEDFKTLHFIKENEQKQIQLANQQKGHFEEITQVMNYFLYNISSSSIPSVKDCYRALELSILANQSLKQ